MTKKKYISLLLLQYVAIVASYGQIAITGVTCVCSAGSSGAIQLMAQGTAGPFYFRWEGSGGYYSEVQNPADITLPGDYTVSVINAYGAGLCPDRTSGRVAALLPGAGSGLAERELRQAGKRAQNIGMLDVEIHMPIWNNYL